jgi:hypothetical protein
MYEHETMMMGKPLSLYYLTTSFHAEAVMVRGRGFIPLPLSITRFQDN